LAPLWLLGVVLCFEPIVFRQSAQSGGTLYWVAYTSISAAIIAGILLGRRRIAERLPSLEVLDDVMYKAIAVGFAFFTIATVLGALWAAEAWGGYWSWDPKETWALICWLVYAAYLHTRLSRGWQGRRPALVASAGLVVIGVCYIGVNLLGIGLHSYGWFFG
jgi:cytochrome c-type biogenesis protein CcsB